jgi:hypothetical protein
MAVGAILLLAVNIRLPFLSLKVTGLVLLLTGLAGLRVPQLARGWLQRHSERLAVVFPPVTDADDGPRVPLHRLLDPRPEPETVELAPAAGADGPGLARTAVLRGGDGARP